MACAFAMPMSEFTRLRDAAIGQNPWSGAGLKMMPWEERNGPDVVQFSPPKPTREEFNREYAADFSKLKVDPSDPEGMRFGNAKLEVTFGGSNLPDNDLARMVKGTLEGMSSDYHDRSRRERELTKLRADWAAGQKTRMADTIIDPRIQEEVGIPFITPLWAPVKPPVGFKEGRLPGAMVSPAAIDKLPRGSWGDLCDVLDKGLEVITWPLRDTEGTFICASQVEAMRYAKSCGGRLATMLELEVIFLTAAWKADPIPRQPPWPTSKDQTSRILAVKPPEIIEIDTIANTGKPFSVERKGTTQAMLSGWYVKRSECRETAPASGLMVWKGITVYDTLLGLEDYRMIQPASSFHRYDDKACGYESHVVIVRET
jgi:hypothetical protein